MMTLPKSVQRNLPRSPEQKRLQRQQARVLRESLQAVARLNRQEAARACRVRLTLDPTRPGDFGDNSGWCVGPLPTLRVPDQHAPHVQDFYDRCEKGRGC